MASLVRLSNVQGRGRDTPAPFIATLDIDTMLITVKDKNNPGPSDSPSAQLLVQLPTGWISAWQQRDASLATPYSSKGRSGGGLDPVDTAALQDLFGYELVLGCKGGWAGPTGRPRAVLQDGRVMVRDDAFPSFWMSFALPDNVVRARLTWSATE